MRSTRNFVADFQFSTPFALRFVVLVGNNMSYFRLFFFKCGIFVFNWYIMTRFDVELQLISHGVNLVSKRDYD
jgi:hypothetical protein